MNPEKKAYDAGRYLAYRCAFLLRNAKWKEANNDKRKIESRAYYMKHRSAILKRQKERQNKDPEAARSRGRKWAKDNPVKARANTAKRRALRIQSIDTSADMRVIRTFYAWAEQCTITTGIKHVVDHIIPLSKGGRHHQKNLQVITALDNSIKASKYPFAVIHQPLPDNMLSG